MNKSRTVIFLLIAFVAGVLAILGGEWGLGVKACPARAQVEGTCSFPAMVTEAQAGVQQITAAEAYQKTQSDPNTLVIDVRDAADIASSGTVTGAVNISLGSLTYKADNQVPESFRDPRLADRSRPIITVCGSGALGSLAAKLLMDKGFTNVSALKGGAAAWKEAGYPMESMTRTFPAMVEQAMKEVPVISAAEAYQRVLSDTNTLIIDPRDASAIAATTGLIKGAANISYGTLTFAADNQVPESFRDPRLADRSRPIITACYSGELGALTAKLLKDMGFTNVSTIKGGTVAWKEAGYPMESTARTFPAMVAEAQAAVPVISPEEAYKRVQTDTKTLVIDVQDAADVAAAGTIKGAVNISFGSLTYKADNQVPESFRDPRLADRSRPIITVCSSGALGSLAAKLLKDMGFTNVSTIKGGTAAWKEAGYPME
ncbi:MAG: rhodanese-like domain-containing protein [Chloroflexi bacterium]|nr:rhodanese-like domain-containing protein [Chloroflexota bacterium]